MKEHYQYLVERDDLTDGQIVDILTEHLKDMYATSPKESVHALNIEQLSHPSITFWSVKQAGTVLGCAAIKHHSNALAELKSMRTIAQARNTGVASTLLRHMIEVATNKGYQSLKLETGTMAFFAPAHRLYKSFGFVECAPFADYCADPNSVFMSLPINT